MAFLCKVEICGVDTSKLPVLKNDQMTILFQNYQAGDEQAREQLIHCNLRLVLSILQRFSNRNENADDLFQVGCIGLMKAIDNFDLSQNVRFSTYAVPMIIGEIRRYIRDNNPIRVSRSLRDIAYKALQVREHADQSVWSGSNCGTNCQSVGIAAGGRYAALDAIQDPVSLMTPFIMTAADPIYIMDQICDTKNTDFQWLENISIKQALDKLTPREQMIIDMRFFQGKTQMEVADEIAISQAQVSRLEKGALQSMRKYV